MSKLILITNPGSASRKYALYDGEELLAQLHFEYVGKKVVCTLKDAKGNKLGTVLFSSPYSDNVKGFNGPTPLLIALDAEGRIKNVVLLENQETPNFAQHVVEGGLFEAWNGLTVDEALGKEVDAVSGATYTSNGVKKSLKARLEAYQRQLKK